LGESLVYELINALESVAGFFEMHGEHRALGQGFAKAPSHRLSLHVPCGTVIPIDTFGRAPLVEDGEGVAHILLLQRLLLAFVGTDESVHEIPLLVVLASGELGKVLPEIEIIEIIPVFLDDIASSLQVYAVLDSLAFGEILHVLVVEHELVENIRRRQAAGQVEKFFTLLGACDDETSARKFSHPIVVGMAKEIEIGEGEFGYSILEQVESRIH